MASGLNDDPRFPEGTLAMQIPHFLELGMDLRTYHRATLNIDFSPCRFEVVRPIVTYRQLLWCPTEPAEDFSFFDCRIAPGSCADAGRSVTGLVYRPHPETKPEHYHSPHVLEILAEYIPGVVYGCRMALQLDTSQLRPLP